MMQSSISVAFYLIGSVKRYGKPVLIATKYQTIEVYRRTSPRWTYDAYEPGDEIELTSLDISLPLAALYRNAGVPEALNDPEGEV